MARWRARGLKQRGDRARDEARWDEAADWYRRYLLVRPDDFAIGVQRGHMLAEAGRTAEADRAYAAAAELRPADGDLLLCWGHACRRAGDAEGARRLYRRSIASGDPRAAEALAQLEPEPGPHFEPEPELEAQPEFGAQPEPQAGAEPAEAPPPAPTAPAGRVDRAENRTLEGHVFAPDGGGDSSGITVEFRADGRIVGHAVPEAERHHGRFRFKTLVDAEPGAEIRAYRLPDGGELDNSPIRLTITEQHRPLVLPPAAWEVDAEIVKPFAMRPRDEVALFVTHSRTGMLKPHVPEYLRALRDAGIRVLLVAVVDRPIDLPDDVTVLVAGAMVRANRGYDFAAWAHAAKLHPEIYGASILYLLNDSVSAPAAGDAFPRLLARVRESGADLIGLTASHEYRWHLQSYFLAAKPALLCSQALQLFLGRVRLLDDKDAVIQAYELSFAADMEAAGYRTETLFPRSTPLNPTLFDWRGLIEAGFPFMKLLPLRGAFAEVDVTGWRAVLERAGFDVPLIAATIAASEISVPGAPDRRLLARPRQAAAARMPTRPKIAYFGLWNYDNGLGAASRGIIAALRRTGFQLNLHPVRKPFHIHRPIAPAVDLIDFAGPADVAIVHLNPDSWHALTEEQHRILFAARKRIGYWVWEMGHIPRDWWLHFESVDRIWAPSRYCAELFAAADTAEVDVIPHPVALPAPAAEGERGRALGEIGLTEDARTILYVFDGSSYLVRKNPAALIRAFQASGLGEAGWTLVLKTKHLGDRPDEGRTLADLAAGVPGVMLVDRVLAPDALGRLIAAADIYASPHCSEGFGLTIAEAMAAGKPVVASDFGGSTDFLDAACGYPVAAPPWRLDRDHGAYPAGGEWARVDETALAAALVQAARDVAAGDATMGAAARRRVADLLSFDAVAGRDAAIVVATLAERGRHPPPPRHVRASLTAGVPPEQAEFGDAVRVVALAADGSVPAGAEGSDAGTGIAAGRDRWIAFVPAGSLLNPLLGRLVTDAARARPDAALFYGDDFAVETERGIDQARLKPEFDLALLVAQDYVGAPLIVRADALAALGGAKRAAGTAAVDELLLAAHAAGLAIARIPEILLAHRHQRPRAATDDRRRVLAASPLLADHDVVDGMVPGTLAQARRFAGGIPELTIVIPTRRSAVAGGTGSHVERLLAGIAAADWPADRLNVIVGDDLAGAPAWAAAGAWPFALDRIETPRAPGEPFNYAAKMNRLWRAAATEHVVFLNDDVRPGDPGWLKALMTFAVDRTVGGVGARLLFKDGRLQHAGLAPWGVSAAHMWVRRRRLAGTYQEWSRVQREWSMVTGAVFATRRSVMEEVGGFDELFSIEFNDTDLCMRMRALGYRIVCTPAAEMVHVEKASRGESPPPGDELARFLARWREWLDKDPSWHPDLRRDRVDMTPLLDHDAWYL